MPIDRERIVQVFFFVLLAVMVYELYTILYPFLVPVVWSILLAFIFHPLMVETERVVHQRTLSALIITNLVALGVILPALWTSALLATEATSLYNQASHLAANGGLLKIRDNALHSHVGLQLNYLLSEMGVRLDEQVPKIAVAAAKFTSDSLVGYITNIFRNLVSFAIDFFLALIILFYMLRDGEDYYHSLRDITPLHEDDKRVVFESLRTTLSAVMRGVMVTAVMQGVIIGLGLLITGVPYWAFLSLASAACALLPFGGTALIWLPATLYLYYINGWGHSLLLLVWCSITVAIIDNLIKPRLTGKGTGLPTLAVFLGIAGGLEAWGAPGLFAGPAVIAVLAALLKVYQKTYSQVRREAA